MFVLITSTIVFPSSNASVNGWIVSGSNALKNAVISSMESAGIEFASKEAKEKAFDAWNMKAYEMWQEDEKNGRNAELWQSFIQESERINSIQAEPIPDKTGFGKMLLNATWFGMAVSIGSDIGYAIEDAQNTNMAMRYLSDGYPDYSDISFNEYLGFSYKMEYPGYGSFKSTLSLLDAKGSVITSLQSTIKDDPALQIHVVNVVDKGGYYELTIYRTNWQNNYSSKENVNKDKTKLATDIGVVYTSVPKIEEVPRILPNPYIEPLIQPNPDIATVPQIIPQQEPVPVIVPSEPFGDNPYIESYVPPGDNPIPKPEPEKPPEETPGTDKDEDGKPNINPNPNTDTPPYVEPEKPPEELPEYPEQTQATETPSLFGKLFEWLKAILDVLFKILNAIIALPFTLLELLWDFLFDIAKALFVPSDNFWDDNMNELKKVIWSDEIDEMIDDFSAVGDGSGGMFKDIVVSLMGVDGLVVIDSDSINSILDNIHSWVRGVFYPLLILFNVNSMYKLIRGTSLVEATRGLANRSKGAE